MFIVTILLFVLNHQQATAIMVAGLCLSEETAWAQYMTIFCQQLKTSLFLL